MKGGSLFFLNRAIIFLQLKSYALGKLSHLTIFSGVYSKKSWLRHCRPLSAYEEMNKKVKCKIPDIIFSLLIYIVTAE